EGYSAREARFLLEEAIVGPTNDVTIRHEVDFLGLARGHPRFIVLPVDGGPMSLQLNKKRWGLPMVCAFNIDDNLNQLLADYHYEPMMWVDGTKGAKSISTVGMGGAGDLPLSDSFYWKESNQHKILKEDVFNETDVTNVPQVWETCFKIPDHVMFVVAFMTSGRLKWIVSSWIIK
ncbi:hypothetical protein MPER_11524, partial [Moniliophthora perniciosa FA553]